MGIIIFWDVTLCDRVFDSQHYETAWWSHLPDSEVPWEPSNPWKWNHYTVKTSGTKYPVMYCHIPEELTSEWVDCGSGSTI